MKKNRGETGGGTGAVCPLAVTCRAAGSPSPAGYSCSASRSTVSMELIHVVHERKVRWPRAFRRLVSFDGLDGWFLDSWLVVWSRYLAGAKALPGIWLVGWLGTARFEEETGLEGESELNLPGRSGACMHGSKAYLRPVIERTRETDRESDPSSQ